MMLCRKIADTILRQLGGHASLHCMIGARDFTVLASTESIRGGLLFSLPAFGKPRVNQIRIELNGEDLYDVYFYFVRAGKAKLVAEVNGVYCDQLVDTVERNTGLYLGMVRLQGSAA